MAFLTDYPGTESYGFTFGPAGALVFDGNVEKAKVAKNLSAFAFPDRQSLTQQEIFGAIDRLAKGKGKE